MNEQSNRTHELIAAWCGPVFVVIFVLTFGFLGHNLPQPISPASSEDVMGRYYADNNGDLRLGWVISLVFISLYLPWTAQISETMRRIETGSRMLSNLQLIAGALTVFVVSFGMLCWAVGSFRPGAGSQKVCRQAVTKQMRAVMRVALNASAIERLLGDHRDGAAGGEAHVRSECAQEQVPSG